MPTMAVYVGDDDLVPQRLVRPTHCRSRRLDHDPAVGRPPSTAAKRSGSVGIRRSTSHSPATTPERRRHATQPPGAAGASDAATPQKAMAGSSPSHSPLRRSNT